MSYSSTASERPHQHLVTLFISHSKGLGQFAEPAEQQLLTLYTQGRLTLDEAAYSLHAYRTQRLPIQLT